MANFTVQPLYQEKEKSVPTAHAVYWGFPVAIWDLVTKTNNNRPNAVHRRFLLNVREHNVGITHGEQQHY
jgi:hypothetical protein